MSMTGAYPVDQGTPVGMFRTEIGDDVGVQNLVPNQDTAEYVYFSDAGIQALLDANPDNYEPALARAFGSMANKLILEAQDIQVDDSRIKTVEKANLFLQRASTAADRAGQSGADAAFSLVPLVSAGSAGACRPEGTPFPWMSM